MNIINTIGPLVVIVLLGAVLYRTQFLPAEVFQANSRLVYWVGLPCLLFYKTAQPVQNLGPAMKVFVVLLIGTMVVILLAYVVGYFLRLGPAPLGAFVQASFRGNLAYVGLPVVFFSIEAIAGKVSPELEQMAVVAIAPLVPLYNIAAVLVLVAGQEENQASLGKRLQEVLFRTLTNPLIIACVLGIAWSFTNVKLPLLALRSVKTVADFSLPLALFAVGASLKLKALRDGFAKAMVGAVLKVMIGPVIGYFVGRLFRLSPLEMQVTLIFLACPTAVASFVMAEQMRSDKDLSARIIVLSVLLSLPVLAIILALG